MHTNMIRHYILTVFFSCFLISSAPAQEHMRFVDLPLTYTPEQMVAELQGRGMHQVMGAGIPHTYRLTGRIAGLNIFLDVDCSRDTLHINHLRLTTQPAVRSVREDYHDLMRWMQKHYGAPTWESTVRSHPFARWYVGFDCDIVMIATAKQTVEIYFYANHQHRNIDYYAILKYCERNPVTTAPHLTARESVTWRSDSAPTVKKKSSRHRVRKKTSRHRRKTKARRSRRRR